MEQLTRLRARLATLAELGDIIGALRALAASSLQEGQRALPAVRRYVATTEGGIADVAAMLDIAAAPPAEDMFAGPEALCLIGSEHGFVGDLNAQLVDQSAPTQDIGLVVVGRRCLMAATERGLEADAFLSMTPQVDGIPLLARQVAETLAGAARVRVAFVRRTATGFGLVARQILPVRLENVIALAGAPPLHQISPAALLSDLAGEYLLAEIASALMEAMIEESTVRLHTLDQADKNIAHKLEELRRKEHALRQEEITTELLDIVVGAEAVSGPDA